MKTEIGNRPLSLAAHLRHVANMLKTSAVNYNWKRPESCNCGLLVRSIMGMTGGELDAVYSKLSEDVPCDENRTPTWTKISGTFCPINPDMPATSIFKKLREAGLNQTDFDHLENLTHPELRWFDKNARANALNLTHYLDKWADKIEAFHAAKTSDEAQLDAVETRPLVVAP